jgi:hypothetical protein
MTRLFISHSTKDIDFVRTRLQPLFDEHGVITWCSGNDTRTASDWQRQIRAALAQADWFIVVLSPDAQRSEWVQAETHWAIENMRGRIIPLMTRSCEPAEVHLRLGTVQYIDFRTDADAAGQRLLALVLGVPPEAATRSPVPDGSAASPEPTTIISGYRKASVLLFIKPRGRPGYEQRLDIRHGAIIGRSEDVDLQIHDDCISRRHAKISVGLSRGKIALTLTDLDSANGTFVNQKQVLPSHPLTAGDVIDIGNVQIHVRAIE